ncbi:MAG: hypothetical protein RR034_03680, partial [Bacteroidales bacterium]
GMYNFPIDHYFWELLAYAAGTGGSILIIGSAAGVAVMGMEKIDFIWYLKHISWIALVGYFCGVGVFVLQQKIEKQFIGQEKVKKTEVVMSEEGIKEYLATNTFYIVQDGQAIQDSTVIKFIEFSDKTLKYSGMNFKAYQLGTTPNDTLFSYNSAANLTLGDCIVNVQDSLAEVVYGGTYMMVTQSGRVFLMSDSGIIPLNIVK